MAVAARRGARVMAVALATAISVPACAGPPPPRAAPSRRAQPASRPAGRAAAGPAAASPAVAIGIPGRFGVAERRVVFTEPAHTGVTGAALGPRRLVTEIRYPHGPPGPPRGGYPLVLFAPGFLQCGRPYAPLLRSWAGAGYVVATVDFPRTDCRVGARAYEPDLVNQPADMSYVLTRLLALGTRPHDPFPGLINRHEIGAAGQSDGGDTVAALAASPCCTDHRVTAVAVLSGAEWPPMPGRYFAHGAPPMLFTQGSADTINPPWTSRQLYQQDPGPARYYLDLFGANHLTPYWGVDPAEQVVARVTLAFFDRYLLGQARALATMTRDASASGTAALAAGGQPPR